MATLFDELQKKLAQPKTAAPAASQQKTVADILAAKSGKSGGGGAAPGASNIGESVAQDAVQAQQGQLNAQGQVQAANIGQAVNAQQQQVDTAKATQAANAAIANQQIATQAQTQSEGLAGQEENATTALQGQELRTVDQTNSKADNTLKALASEKGTTVDNLFREFTRGNQELVFRKDAAELEQRGFLLAMRDKSYLDELNRVGVERDLGDKLNYSEEMQRLVLGDQLDRLLDDLGFKTLLSADQRSWNERLAHLDNESLLQAAEAAIKDQNRNMMASGAGDVAKSGIDAYYKYNKKTPTDDDSEDDNLPDNAGETDLVGNVNAGAMS